MAVTLGQEGCLNADLAIAQHQALAIEITHEDESGEPIDHTGDDARCRLQRRNRDDVILDSYLDMDDAASGVDTTLRDRRYGATATTTDITITCYNAGTNTTSRRVNWLAIGTLA